jgi:hypothetical protein
VARIASILSLLSVVVFLVAPAQGGDSRAKSCNDTQFQYAGLASNTTAHGVRATITQLSFPTVTDGHVAAWVGVGGPDAGPNGEPEWLQTGFAAFAPWKTTYLYYEVAVPGKYPAYHQVLADVRPGQKHDVRVLEVQGRNSWWRVWVDGKAVSPAIHLVGSHNSWYPEASAENWNGGTGTCNGFAYRFSNVRLAKQNGGVWASPTSRQMFQDPGYQVRQTSRVPTSFVATSQ